MGITMKQAIGRTLEELQNSWRLKPQDENRQGALYGALLVAAEAPGADRNRIISIVCALQDDDRRRVDELTTEIVQQFTRDLEEFNREIRA